MHTRRIPDTKDCSKDATIRKTIHMKEEGSSTLALCLWAILDVLILRGSSSRQQNLHYLWLVAVKKELWSSGRWRASRESTILIYMASADSKMSLIPRASFSGLMRYILKTLVPIEA